MQKVLVIFTTLLLTFSFIKCEEEDTDFDGSNKIGVLDIMKKCNETFRIEISYLHELHKSGKFPDETDKTPKCYIRCVLVGIGVTTEEGQFNARQAGLAIAEVNPKVQAKEIEELATGCVDRHEECKCERSYQFVKCLTKNAMEKLGHAK